MRRKRLIYCIFISLTMCFATLSVRDVGAANSPVEHPPLCATFLTFRSWFCGLSRYKLDSSGNEALDDNGRKIVEFKEIVEVIRTDEKTGQQYVMDEATKKERKLNSGREITLTVLIWGIVLNILNVLFSLVGYLALGFLVFGGYQYILARGDPGKVAKGKKTITAAITGTIICILASLIVSTIIEIITGAVGA